MYSCDPSARTVDHSQTEGPRQCAGRVPTSHSTSCWTLQSTAGPFSLPARRFARTTCKLTRRILLPIHPQFARTCKFTEQDPADALRTGEWKASLPFLCQYASEFIAAGSNSIPTNISMWSCTRCFLLPHNPKFETVLNWCVRERPRQLSRKM